MSIASKVSLAIILQTASILISLICSSFSHFLTADCVFAQMLCILGLNISTRNSSEVRSVHSFLTGKFCKKLWKECSSDCDRNVNRVLSFCPTSSLIRISAKTLNGCMGKHFFSSISVNISSESSLNTPVI